MLNGELKDKVAKLSLVELTIAIDVSLLEHCFQLFLPFVLLECLRSYLGALDVFKRQLLIRLVCLACFPVSIELSVHPNNAFGFP